MKKRVGVFIVFCVGVFLLNLLFFQHLNGKQTLTLALPNSHSTVVSELSAKDIQWSRKVRTLPSHLEIEDTFLNSGKVLQGLQVIHSLAAGFDQVWLGGQDLPALLKNLNIKQSPVDFSDPWNPTLYTVSSSGSVALVAEDDVFRQQVRVFFSPAHARAGIKTESLCLGPGQSYTMKWTIYTQASKSYWDFINTLRADWRVNHMISGSFMWFQPTDILRMDAGFLAEDLHRQNVTVANMYGGWIDEESPSFIGFGAATLLPEFAHLRTLIQASIHKLKVASTKIKVLVYFDAQRDSSPNAAKEYSDSLFLNVDLTPDYTNWMGKFNRTWSTVPTLTNAYGKKLQAVVSAMKELGADGLYWDEMESLDYSGVRATYGEWDGFSCALGAKQKILHQIGYVNLLSNPAKLHYAENAGIMMANSPPTTRAFQERSDVHMVEGQHRLDYSSYAHLTTPLAYIGSDDDWKTIIAPIEKGLIPASVRLEYKTSFFSALYPITPQKIFPGLVLGKEKIVTTRSGVYGWKTQCANLHVHAFDAKGNLLIFSGKIERLASSCKVKLELKKDEAVILERVPSVSAGAQEMPLFYDPVFL